MFASLLLTAGWSTALHARLDTPAGGRAGSPRMDFMQKLANNDMNTANKMKLVKKGQAPKLRGVRLPPAMVDVTQSFKREYPQKEKEVLWAAMLKCYGNAQRAEAAVLENPQMLNPSYSFCNTMLASKEVLVDMMGEEDALDVMMMNPAVLQCGPSLDTLGPDEIKGFARIRSAGNRIPEAARGYALSLLLATCAFPLIAKDIPELAFANEFVKPLVGILFAIAIEGSRIVIVGTIIKAKMSNDEKAKAAIEKAQANERRRMGK